MNAVREFADIIEKHRVFILTGAGVRAESGIPTLRDECDRHCRTDAGQSAVPPRIRCGAASGVTVDHKKAELALSQQVFHDAEPFRIEWLSANRHRNCRRGRVDPEGEVSTGEIHVLHHPGVISFDIKTVVNGGR